MKALVTGGNGFLGSHIVAELNRRGYDSIAPRSTEFDLREFYAATSLVRQFAPDAIIHAAGRVGGIGANQAHPAQFFFDNLMMGVNIIHAAKLYGVRKTVMIGTTCSYPKFAPIPFGESDLWDGYPEETNAPYGIAKRALLTMAQAYRAEYGMNIVYLIPANLYGCGDHFDDTTSHVIPALIKKFFHAKDYGETSVTLWGDGTPTREFLYAPDATRGIALALEKYDSPEPLNLGGTPEISISELAKLIASLVGYQGEIIWDTTKPNGQPRRQLDAARAESLLRWRAETKLADGLRQTIEWYRNNERTI